MRLPQLPVLKQFKRLTPTLYEAALACKARAVWTAFGQRDAVPQHPRALLGMSLHAVLEAAHKGQIAPNDEASCRAAARSIFEMTARDLYDHAHPLLRAKFKTPERLPYYNLFRERAALLAVDASARSRARSVDATRPAPVGPSQSSDRAEAWLTSPDGLLAGRSDYLDPSTGEVVDYKTNIGPEDEPGGIHNSEARQLRLYVHLGQTAGIKLTKGVVVRADGRRIVLNVSEQEASAEGQRAREILKSLNDQVGRPFEQLADPSADNCRYCPCMPSCEPFWNSASPTWAEQCGSHIEGTITSMQRTVAPGATLLTFGLVVERGTVTPGPAVVEQLPESWATADNTPSPSLGDRIRLLNARIADNPSNMIVIRADRLASAIWTVAPSSSTAPTK